MRNLWVAFVGGFLFAIGLGVGMMTQADRVIGFLDVGGRWDPSLMFVMAGALGVHFLTSLFIRKRGRPLWAHEFVVPAKSGIDLQLVGGAALFGLGWGLGGYCPGPALVSLASLQAEPIVFVVAMTIGMVGFNVFSRS